MQRTYLLYLVVNLGVDCIAPRVIGLLTQSLVSKSQIKELIMCINVAVHKSNVISTTCGVANCTRYVSYDSGLGHFVMP